jgi:sulfur-oxidizing protein SoxY
MERRQFLSLALGSLALVAVPASVRAEDYRKLKPTAWTAKTVDEAIKNLYGSLDMKTEGVSIKTPDVASNGGAIPVDYKITVPVKSVAVFQDANPEATVCVNTVGKYEITEYSIKIKMAKSGTITVVAEGQDGKLYVAKRTLKVALGGCEG